MSKQDWLTDDQVVRLSELIEFYYSKGLTVTIADVTEILYPASAPDATNRRTGE